jgi:Zn-dependent membrane protease YugP
MPSSHLSKVVLAWCVVVVGALVTICSLIILGIIIFG